MVSSFWSGSGCALRAPSSIQTTLEGEFSLVEWVICRRFNGCSEGPAPCWVVSAGPQVTEGQQTRESGVFRIGATANPKAEAGGVQPAVAKRAGRYRI